jgi:KDO2-lipid IV(A) lauroyltransferase
MNLQGLLNSRRAGMLALRVSRRLPPKWGYRLADTLADRIAASSQTPMVQGIRANQWIVSDQRLRGEALDQVVRETMRHMARSFYTLFHYLEVLDRFQNLIDYDAHAEAVIAQSQEAGQGLVVVGVHMSSFDLVAQASALRGLRALGLSLPQPDEAVEWQHEFRRHAGLEILPASIHNIRQTIERLKAGETVLTGLDRPLPDPLYRPRFFGHPANVPVHYIQLALKAGVPLVVMAAIEQPEGRYRVVSSDLIHLEHYADRHSEIVNNAEKVLMVAEGFIRRAPQQWAIFQPVWPDLLLQVP